ncbi:MAG: hypothetical protein HDQ98_09175 [Lachnospiraceae bacterium]|nr:hypothetical protein [Lachnospiraceae bacterium]
MAAIKIDMKRVRDANDHLPSMLSVLSEQRMYIQMRRRGIPPEIQGRRHIGERLNDILRELDRAEQQLKEIYSETENAVIQYTKMEAKLTAIAERLQ